MSQVEAIADGGPVAHLVGRVAADGAADVVALLDVSIVLPCLNEAAVVGQVVADARKALVDAGLRGEVIVSDNGSTDGSDEIARASGARVVYAPERGYGNAYHMGMDVACGRVLVMADADGTYPMEVLPALVAPVLAGDADMVIGSRLHGTLTRSSMPWLHRRVGTPVLTGVLNRFFGVTVTDAHSGMRAIDAATYQQLGLSTPGMEYASEMIVKAAQRKLRITEVPIEYRPRVGESKLQTWPDGWRHLKFLMLSSPTWLFLLPGLLMCAVGAAIVVPLTFGPLIIGPIRLILHPMVVGAALVILGYQMVQFGLLIRACMPVSDGIANRVADFFVRRLTLERVLLIGGAVFAVGFGVMVAILVRWAGSHFGPLSDIRVAISALTVCVIGAQTIFAGFLYAFFLPATFGGGVSSFHLVGRAQTKKAEKSL